MTDAKAQPKPAVVKAAKAVKVLKVALIGAKLRSPLKGTRSLSLDFLRATSTGTPSGFQKSVRLDTATMDKKYPAAWAMIQKGLAEIEQGEAGVAFKS